MCVCHSHGTAGSRTAFGSVFRFSLEKAYEVKQEESHVHNKDIKYYCDK